MALNVSSSLSSWSILSAALGHSLLTASHGLIDNSMRSSISPWQSSVILFSFLEDFFFGRENNFILFEGLGRYLVPDLELPVGASSLGDLEQLKCTVLLQG